jgi:hypothetical protein
MTADRCEALRGVSMWPLTRPWRAWIDQRGADVLRRGDIGVYLAADGRLVFHRVISVGADVVRFRPDTLGHDDPPVPRAAVLGRVAALQLGSVRLRLPSEGRGADGLRTLGLGWSRVAPGLRRQLAGPTRRARHALRRAVGGAVGPRRPAA